MIFSLALLYFLAAGFKSSLPLLLPFIAEDIHLSLSNVGLLGAMIHAIGIFIALPSGYIAQKIGSIKLLVFTFLIYSVVFLTLSVTSNFHTLFLVFLLAGIGFGLFLPVALSVLAKLAPSDSRGKHMGSFSANGDIGRMIIGGSVGFLVAFMGWQLTSIFYGLVAFIVFLVMYIKFVHKNVAVESKSKALPEGTLLKHFFTDKHYILANTAGALDILAGGSLFIFLPFLLISKGFDPTIIGSLTITYFLGSYFGKTIIGRLVDKYGNKPLFIVSELLMGLCILLLVLINSFVVIIGLSLLLGALTKGTVPAALSLVTESLDRHGAYEKGFALNTLIISVAATLGPLVLGIFANDFGIESAFYLSGLFSLLAIFPVILLGAMNKKESCQSCKQSP